MSTTYRCELNQQSKGVVASVKIESDELSKEDIIAETKTVFREMKHIADSYTALELR